MKNVSEEQAFKALEEMTKKVYAQPEARREAPPASTLQAKAAEVYAAEPGLLGVLGLTAAGSGTAKYILVDYSFTTSVRYLWAYVDTEWKHTALNEDQVAGIAKVVLEANTVQVWWTDSQITFIRCWK